ncbi:hypothetical protein M9H77_32606 [Catharanthus roseus]|uniref:Uncharacterized protein n=1 Tax=Catharanthus roseus TaxID=4058 RepID=A0ACC0A3P9_CATRO|nr:hypothetical protein M9H77_32606 [Catharanthus roseus]
MFMEEEEEGSLPPPSIFFNPSSSPPLLTPPPTTTSLINQPTMQISDIDWATIFSSTSSLNNGGAATTAEQKPRNPPTSHHHGHNMMMKLHKAKCGGGKSSKKYVTPRVAFHTRSTEDILDDGYKWRKYGQKSVKNSSHPRSYYRCTHHTCNVKKQIQRLSKDTSVVVTTYEGIHSHPCEKLMETLTPLLKQLQFLSRF